MQRIHWHGPEGQDQRRASSIQKGPGKERVVLRRKQSDLAKAGFLAYCRLDVYAPGLDGGKERGPGILPASCRGSKTPETLSHGRKESETYICYLHGFLNPD
ncbi:hypothetical protein MUG91_G88n31 [Manis pentadactyla]|nr:hypothetical protein MUG91_G88n31 [Manis pentadactyla]